MKKPSIKFYNIDLNTPMSEEANNDWDNSRSKELHDINEAIFIHYVEGSAASAEYIWKLANVTVSNEDVTMSYFRAFGIFNEYLPQATFGVNFSSVNSRINTSKFKYKPKFGNDYYIPIQNNLVTVNTGGYKVQVLDLNYPSEILDFGYINKNNKHQGLVIDFKLFANV